MLGTLLAVGLAFAASSNAFAQYHHGWPDEPLNVGSAVVAPAPAVQSQPIPYTTNYRGPMTAPTGWYWSHSQNQWYWFDGYTLQPAKQQQTATQAQTKTRTR